jgi:hypothetical protein
MRPTRLALLLAVLAAPAFAQPQVPPADWKPWAPLLGTWQGDAKGPGDPTGGFTLSLELGGRVLVRKNHADYPKSATRPGFKHEDLMVMSQEGGTSRAEYWDNEGHVIHYAVTVEGERFVLVSDAVPGQPRFRFTYELLTPKTLKLAFEMTAPDAPEDFKPYILATAHKTR